MKLRDPKNFIEMSKGVAKRKQPQVIWSALWTEYVDDYKLQCEYPSITYGPVLFYKRKDGMNWIAQMARQRMENWCTKIPWKDLDDDRIYDIVSNFDEEYSFVYEECHQGEFVPHKWEWELLEKEIQ